MKLTTNAFPPIRRRFIALASAALWLATAPFQAEGVVITSITTAPPAGPGDYTTNATLTSFTAGGVTYTNLAGPSMVIVNTNTDWLIPNGESTVGVTDESVISGLVPTTGLLDSDVEFYFSGGLTLDTMLFVLENGNNGDLANIVALDAAGNRLTTNKVLSSGNINLMIVDQIREGGSALNDRSIVGFAFTLRELGFSEASFDPGELELLSGVELATTSFDTAVLGMVVPEPGALWLSLGALVGFGLLRQRRAAA